MNQEGAFYQRESFLYLIAILASVGLSIWINVRESVINVDAICYLLSAEAMSHSSLHDAMHVCPQAKWPFYSLLIYGLTSLSSLSYVASAYILNGIFSAISVVTFIAIIKALSGSRRLMWLGLMVILLSHQFNSVREYIVRDHGFWAFYLISLLCLLHYFHTENRTSSWKYAIAWSASLLVATLFRIEGAIFLLILPFLSWCCVHHSFKQRTQRFFQLYAPVLFICAGMASWLLLHPQQTIEKLGRVQEVVNQFQHGFAIMLESYQSTKRSVEMHVLSHESARDAGLMMAITFCVWYLVYILGNLSWIYSFLVAYAISTRAAMLKRSAQLVLGGYLFINLLVTAGFFTQHLFLAKRYLIAFSLVLMLWVPFALNQLWQQSQMTSRARALLAVVVVGIFLSSLGGIVEFGYSKAYIRQAGSWVVENVPERASLYINDEQLMYYSQRYQ